MVAALDELSTTSGTTHSTPPTGPTTWSEQRDVGRPLAAWRQTQALDPISARTQYAVKRIFGSTLPTIGVTVMATKFNDYIGEVEDKAKAGDPESAARWDAFNANYAVAREMRELRKARNLTQKQLAAASGIDQAEISRIERGQTNPTTSTLAALLGPLGARLGVVAVKSRDRAKI
jgi:DNA-binding XRE family transcriptional regulator